MTDARGELPHEVVATRASTSPTPYSEQTVILTEQTEPTAPAVLYLRVSTKEQAEMGGTAEGFSIPAQREAALRKAESLEATVVAEFVDRGESARSANRPELQKLLRFVAENRVDYVIVHKVDRLARNRADDVEINLALQAAGVKLVSVTENIDETPSGMLLHGIMSSIAEFYSRNLANEVIKGSTQKAKSGGTVGRAPVGYVNVRKIIDGREVRTIDLDPDRAPLMAWAFEQYATGDWTTRTLLQALTDRGLRSRGTRTAPGKQLAQSHFCRLLTSPYYVGIVSYRGATYPGSHQPLVSQETFDRVQAVLASRNNSGEKTRNHPHYLKSSLRCGSCGSRMLVSHARGKGGTIYKYFLCAGRHEKRNSCQLPALRIEAVEREVVLHYRTVQLSPERCDEIRDVVRELVRRWQTTAEWELRQQKRRKAELEDQQRKLLEAHYADAIPVDLLKQEQKRIKSELGIADARIVLCQRRYHDIEERLDLALALVGNLAQTYRSAPGKFRRRFNQALFEAFYVDEDGSLTGEPTEPFAAMLDEDLTREIAALLDSGDTNEEARTPFGEAGFSGTGPDPTVNTSGSLREMQMVGAEGLEPPTSAL